MTALTKLNTLISAGVERGLTQTAIAALLEISPRTLGRLRDGAPIDATREAKIDSALRDLGVNASTSRRVKASSVVEDAPLTTVDALNRILDIAPRIGSSKTAIADLLGTSRRTLDRWADGVHPIPADIEEDIREVLSDFEAEVEESYAPAVTATVVVVEEDRPVVPVTENRTITMATVALKNNCGVGVSTLARSFADVDQNLSIIYGLDECNFLLNKPNLGNIQLNYIPETSPLVGDYYRRTESFARGSGQVYVVSKDGDRQLFTGVNVETVSLFTIGIQVGSGTVSIGGKVVDIEDVAYLILSPELGDSVVL